MAAALQQLQWALWAVVAPIKRSAATDSVARLILDDFADAFYGYLQMWLAALQGGA